MDTECYAMNAEIEEILTTVDKEGLEAYSKVIKGQELLYIAMSCGKIALPLASVLKMMDLADCILEEWTIFSFYDPEPAIAKHKDELLGNSTLPIIEDPASESLLNAANEAGKGSKKARNKSVYVPAKMNYSIALSVKEHSFIGRHYCFIKSLWYIMYSTFLLGSIGLFVHLTFIILGKMFTVNIYTIMLIILGIVLLVTGLYGLTLNHLREKVKIKPLYFILPISLCATIPFLFFVSASMMGNAIYDSMGSTVLFYYIWYDSIILMEILAMWFNYKMGQFYRKYQDTLFRNKFLIGDFGLHVE